MVSVIADCILVIHIILILLIILLPFCDTPYFLMLHSVFVPFLILHWVTNNNTCVLTTTEKYLRNKKSKDDEDDCLTCKLINPIFDFKKNHIDSSNFIYFITISLWFVSSFKLLHKYKSGKIKSSKDLFKTK